MRRYIVTGAPGAGKTTILAALRGRGYAVVGEAATDVIARAHAAGVDEPWREASFLDDIALLQRDRQRDAPPPGTAVQLFDRSPICTLALAAHLGRPATPALTREVERILAERVYEPQVFFVRLLDVITPTAARRITLEDSRSFERIHERVYRDQGFELVDVPVAPLADRVDAIDRFLRSAASA